MFIWLCTDWLKSGEITHCFQYDHPQIYWIHPNDPAIVLYHLCEYRFQERIVSSLGAKSDEYSRCSSNSYFNSFNLAIVKILLRASSSWKIILSSLKQITFHDFFSFKWSEVLQWYSVLIVLPFQDNKSLKSLSSKNWRHN